MLVERHRAKVPELVVLEVTWVWTGDGEAVTIMQIGSIWILPSGMHGRTWRRGDNSSATDSGESPDDPRSKVSFHGGLLCLGIGSVNMKKYSQG